MKVETPQILWHSDPNGKAAPLYSISALASGLSKDRDEDYGTVVATAGNSSDIHLWKVCFSEVSCHGGISHLVSLIRHERSVNALAFSPDGIHLATAGDGGSVIIWSVPTKKRGNGNGCHFWGTYLQEEKDLDVKILPSSNSQDIMDISWSANSQRFVCGSLDHSIFVWELSTANQNWTCIYRNSNDHSHYVQGVILDPLGVYLASQGSDRSVCVYSNAPSKKGKKNVPNNHWTKVKTIKHYSNTKKHNLFADESTVESFFRRLSWTCDGAFLIAPSALWHKKHEEETSPSFATLLFARHNYDQPYKVLTGHEKPSVAIRPNPVFFQYPPKFDRSKSIIPYRSVFAVLTLDSILIYDTCHSRPLAVAKGLHYAGLTDCAWSKDGHKLMVTSTDGYISILIFQPGELGEVYEAEETDVKMTTEQETDTAKPKKDVTVEDTNSPKPDGVDNPSENDASQENNTNIEEVNEPVPKKAKKRIQPLLVS